MVLFETYDMTNTSKHAINKHGISYTGVSFLFGQLIMSPMHHFIKICQNLYNLIHSDFTQVFFSVEQLKLFILPMLI